MLFICKISYMFTYLHASILHFAIPFYYCTLVAYLKFDPNSGTL